jgi:benzoyl-CoA reductase/2-hydroxyglutaryl-CoA dehydratase subunit BcrC/BadD/HgdB
MTSKNNTKNTMVDLNNHLFEQMERLNDNELSTEGLKKEIARTHAMREVAVQIIDNARTVVQAAKVFNEGLIKKFPAMLDMEHREEI